MQLLEHPYEVVDGVTVDDQLTCVKQAIKSVEGHLRIGKVVQRRRAFFAPRRACENRRRYRCGHLALEHIGGWWRKGVVGPQTSVGQLNGSGLGDAVVLVGS